MSQDLTIQFINKEIKLDNKYMERCSTSLVTKEMQMKL